MARSTTIFLLAVLLTAFLCGRASAKMALCCNGEECSDTSGFSLSGVCSDSFVEFGGQDFGSFIVTCSSSTQFTAAAYADGSCSEVSVDISSMCEDPVCKNACDFHSPLTKNDIIQGIVSLIVGLATCFYGYRLFKIELFIAGFIFGGGITYVVLRMYTDFVLWQIVLTCLGVGIVAGVLVIVLFYIGIFLIGAIFGVLIVVVLLHVTHETTWAITHLNVLIGILVTVGVIFGALAIIFSRHLIIIATSFNGGYLFARGIDLLADNSRLQEDLLVALKINSPSVYSVLCWKSYVILSTMCVFILAGLAVQYRITAKNYSHKKNKVVVLQMANIHHHHHYSDNNGKESDTDDQRGDFDGYSHSQFGSRDGGSVGYNRPKSSQKKWWSSGKPNDFDNGGAGDDENLLGYL